MSGWGYDCAIVVAIARTGEIRRPARDDMMRNCYSIVFLLILLRWKAIIGGCQVKFLLAYVLATLCH